MKMLIDKVQKLVDEETERIVEEWGDYHSDHEGISVLREEQDEVRCEYVRTTDEIDRLWRRIKESKELLDKDIIPNNQAWIFLACEAIQCASVCEKLRRQKQ